MFEQDADVAAIAKDELEQTPAIRTLLALHQAAPLEPPEGTRLALEAYGIQFLLVDRMSMVRHVLAHT
jgi:hypothetical protein